MIEAHQRADFLARALAKRLDFSPNEGVEWDKVVSIFSVNTVGYNPLILSTGELMIYRSIASPLRKLYTD